MTRFHDVPFVVEPAEALNAAERELLDGMSPGPTTHRVREPFRLQIVPAGDEIARDAPADSRADIRWIGNMVTVRHETFAADLWPLENRGTLKRHSNGPFPLQLTVETAACSILPASGAIVLHAACIVIDDRACVFFGPSGIGKSTLARLSPYPIMAEELVAISAQGEPVASSCECLPDSARDREYRNPAPIAAIFELSRSESVEIVRLGSQEAARSLLGSTLVYPIPALWRDALAIIESVVSSVPVYRFGWAMQENAWDEIRDVVREGKVQ